MINREYANIRWEGNSKEVLSAFPDEVKGALGFSLRRIQSGLLPACDCRPMPSVGKNVWELKTDDPRTWYRLMYVTQIGKVVYVLHAFEKASTKTPKNDIQTARARLSEVLQRIRESKAKERKGKEK